VSIGEQKQDWTLGQHRKKIFQIFSELFFLVSSCEGNSEKFVFSGETSQFCQTLFAWTSIAY